MAELILDRVTLAYTLAGATDEAMGRPTSRRFVDPALRKSRNIGRVVPSPVEGEVSC